ncbi:protoporphyrinogen oxidase [mine drainage metagenome]|uniref:Protoporphyrinogen oxidase n=1 Tax=mine drainage metagenome TaxID=410659 RepID=T1DE54_9ZZZZ
MTARVAILGGGISGLGAAYGLRKAIPSASEVELTVIESRPDLGGTIGTEGMQGFRIERGPDSFVTLKPRAYQLAGELSLGPQVVGVRSRGFYGVRHGTLVPAPEALVLVAPARLGAFFRTRLLSVSGKLRASFDVFLPARPNDGDESLASFVRRRLGREMLDRIADPLVAGIHAGDPEKLSMESLLPQFIEYERTYRSVIRGLRASARSRPASTSTVPRPFASFRGGMGELTQALVAKTPGVAWRTGVRALRLERTRDGRFQVGLSDGTTWTGETVVLTVPTPVAEELVRGLSPRLATALRAIHYSSSVIVSLGFREQAYRAPSGSGVVVPRNEGFRLSACTFSSIKFEGRAPPGHALVRAFYGGARDEAAVELSDETIVGLAEQELGRLIGLRAPVEVIRVHRWPKAHPQYEVGHRDRVAEVEAACAEVPGLFLAGSGYRGIGISDCLEDADRAVQGVLATLRGDLTASVAVAV